MSENEKHELTAAERIAELEAELAARPEVVASDEIAAPSTAVERAKAAGAKLPADHAAKQEAKDEPVALKIRGVDIVVDPRRARDWEALEEMQVGMNPFPLLNGILGEYRKPILDAIRGPDGIVDSKDVRPVLDEIMEALGLGN